MTEEELFIDAQTDDLDHAPAQRRRRAAEVPKERHFGCPIWWLRCVLPVVNSKNQLVVAIYLYRRRAVLGWGETFDVPNTELKTLGILRQTKYQTLILLEAAGLIRIRRSGKKAPTVTILSKEPGRRRQ